MHVFSPVAIMPRYVCPTDFGIRGNEPDEQYWQKTPECKVLISTNSKGIRADYEIAYEKPDGVHRIVVLGDSFGMGYEVSLEDTFTSQMVRFLKEKGVPAEVVNLSVSGHGNAEEYIMLMNEGFKYDPDLVLLEWHSTDIQDNVRSGLFALEDGKLVAKNKTYLPGTELSKTLFSIPGYRLMAENSQLYSYFREKIAMEIKDLLVVLRGRTKAAAASSEEEESAAVKEYRENLTVALLGAIQQECRQRGVSFMILDIPRIRGKTEFWSVFPMQKAASLGLDYYCPAEVFKKNSDQKIYWEKGHGHLTPLGCKITGKGLADYIYDRQLLTSGDKEEK